MSEKDFDQTEEATPYKLEKAKEKGQVAKSTEVISVAVSFVLILFIYWRGDGAVKALFHKCASWFGMIPLYRSDVLEVTGALHLLSEALWMLLPFLLLICLVAVLANISQTGFILSFDPVKPDFERLNPVAGFKKFVSAKVLFDLFRVLLKLLLLLSVSYFALSDFYPELRKIPNLTWPGLIKFTVASVVSIGFKLVLALSLIAFIDYVYTQYDFSKKMRMSKRDVKDEHKNREGDPRIRSRLRELRREMLKKSMSAKNTREADVIITNPVHLAIALKYEHGEMSSPKVLAKGAGALAQAMKKLARKHNIPIVENKPLAQKLFKQLEIDQHVPEHLYAEVAKIMVWIFAMRKLRSHSVNGVGL